MNELQDAHVHLYLAAKRHATMKAMLEQMTSPDFQQALAEVEKAERRREVAKEKLARRRELLEAAPSFGSCKNLEEAEAAVSVAEAELEKAEENIRVMRGDCSESYPSSQPQKNSSSTSTVETESASGGDEAWKGKARDRAAEIIKRDRAKDLYPSQQHIADEIAREFRRDGVTGADGKPLAGSYIKRHALGGISSAQGKQLSTAIHRGK